MRLLKLRSTKICPENELISGSLDLSRCNKKVEIMILILPREQKVWKV
jgi:hypothetical protein